MISGSVVAHLADSFQGLPDAHANVKYLMSPTARCHVCVCVCKSLSLSLSLSVLAVADDGLRALRLVA